MMELIWAILKPGIISAVCAGAVFLVISFLFPGKVPKIVSELRWLLP